jgi:protein gp37
MILGEWSKPAQWNKAAEKAGVKARVFCASMCDLFEDFDGPVVDQTGNPVKRPADNVPWTVPSLRYRALSLVKETPWLDWLLLTKRPENVLSMVPDDWRVKWPSNVIVGTSPCDQATADRCIPQLLEVPGRRFLSMEPLLGPVEIRHIAMLAVVGKWWVIVGGESGPKARACDVAWIRSVVEQCKAAGVPCFVKQLGARVHCRNDEVSEWLDEVGMGLDFIETDRVGMQGDPVRVMLNDKKGGDMAEWPDDLRVREFPTEGVKP